MLGLILNRDETLFFKSGFKQVKFNSKNISIDRNYFATGKENFYVPNNDFRVFSFEECDIETEKMTTIIIRSCIVLPDAFADSQELIHKINESHLKRFISKYGSYFTGIDWSQFVSMDVIDLKNIREIKSDESLEQFDCYSIFPEKAMFEGKGMHTECNSNFFFYLLVPNVRHRILHDNGINKLTVTCKNGKTPDNLLFLRFMFGDLQPVVE